ncbi:MAG TPA: CPBP family intramembrane glutamic endopeptidase [Candidatus Angelobacter sp.]|jgi:membrane protease YdiL (CAAX protease family)|nr:CPBP family intramembrane glutamic endopeptidase [Candidatus Angelobacter sp.]
MSDAVVWTLIVLAILAVQAAEGPPGEAAKARPAPRRGESLSTVFSGALDGLASATKAIIAAGAGLALIVGLLSLAGANGSTSGAAVDRNQQIVSGALQVVAGGLSLLLFYTGTSRVPGLRNLRPAAPISWLAIFLLLESLAANFGTLTTASGGAVVGGTPTLRPATGPSARDLMLGEVPFLAIGIAAVGPVVRRNLRETAERLGVWPLRLPWWVVGIAAGVVLVPLGGYVVELLNHLASASCVAQTSQAEQAIVGVGRTGLEQAGIAIAAGVCEELLFRGALQPRVGIVLSSVVWASYHLQYLCNGLPSPANLYLVLLGLLLGVLRKWGGLWPAILAHSVYDGLILLHLLGA